MIHRRFLAATCLLIPLLTAAKLRSAPPSQPASENEDSPPTALRIEPYSLQVTKLPRDQFGFGVKPWNERKVTGWLASSGTVLVMRVEFKPPVLNVNAEATRLRFTDDKGTDLTSPPDGKWPEHAFTNNKVLVFERGNGGDGELTVRGFSTPAADATKVIVQGNLIAEVGLGDAKVEESTIELSADRSPLAIGPIRMSAVLTRSDRLQISFQDVGPGFDRIEWIGPDGKSQPSDPAFVPAKNESINYRIPELNNPRLTVRATYYAKTERKTLPIRVETGLGF
jgi:hypothetical protein